MIKTKKTAIKHLHNRKTEAEFATAKFDLFRGDKEVALLAVSTSKGFFSDLNNVSEELKDDVDVVIAAVKNTPKAIYEASVRLKRCLAYSSNPQLMDNSQEEVLPVLYAIKEIESKGCVVPEELNVFKVRDALNLVEELSMNVMDNLSAKPKKIKI